MKLPRRQFLHLAAGAAALPAVSRFARAQAYPTRPVRIIVPYPPGGTPDIVGRMMGEWLSERLGQQFIIENRPGAGGNIGTETAVRAPADGYTLLYVVTANAISPALFDKLNFNFLHDIAPVGGITRVPNVVSVTPSLPVATISQLIAHAKDNPGKLNFGAPTAGTLLLAGRAVQDDGRRQHRSCGLSWWRGAGRYRPACRPTSGKFRCDADGHRIRQGWQAARVGGDHSGALAGTAGPAAGWRFRARVRGELMARHRGAQEYAR